MKIIKLFSLVGLVTCLSWTNIAAATIETGEQLNTQEKLGADLPALFEEKRLKLGSALFVRVFKQSSELELWVERGSRYVLFKTYTICRWSGTLGAKLREGDRQSPEGLYRITAADLIVSPRWHRALTINYPNSFDRVNGRYGSGIMIHGKCSSIGCFALQDHNIEEVYDAARAALSNGQESIPVFLLPFRFSAKSGEATPVLDEFWSDLKRGDALFLRDKLPPSAWLCDGRYHFADRRGDRRRHAVHLPDCQPLDRPVAPEKVAAFMAKRLGAPASGARLPEAVREAVQNEAKGCNPIDPKCRLLRRAISSSVICPQKYGRCRTQEAVYTKSAECPLKYPRCRWFVGPDPKLAQTRDRATAKP